MNLCVSDLNNLILLNRIILCRIDIDETLYTSGENAFLFAVQKNRLHIFNNLVNHFIKKKKEYEGNLVIDLMQKLENIPLPLRATYIKALGILLNNKKYSKFVGLDKDPLILSSIAFITPSLVPLALKHVKYDLNANFSDPRNIKPALASVLANIKIYPEEVKTAVKALRKKKAKLTSDVITHIKELFLVFASNDDLESIIAVEKVVSDLNTSTEEIHLLDESHFKKAIKYKSASVVSHIILSGTYVDIKKHAYSIVNNFTDTQAINILKLIFMHKIKYIRERLGVDIDDFTLTRVNDGDTFKGAKFSSKKFNIRMNITRKKTKPIKGSRGLYLPILSTIHESTSLEVEADLPEVSAGAGERTGFLPRLFGAKSRK